MSSASITTGLDIYVARDPIRNRKPPAPPGATMSHGRRAAVIGGGPAGLMAAEYLAEAGVAVTVYERMPSVGRKLLMAGRGGLNLTHTEPFAPFLARYDTAAAWLRPILADFTPEDLRRWAHGLGQETFVGSSGRVFPRAFKASPLLRAWLARLDRDGVSFALRHRWMGFDGAGRALFDTEGGPVGVEAGATILALGGASWPRLGSDGHWVDTLARHGVAVAPLRPANVGFVAQWSDPFRERFSGAPLKRIALAFQGARVRGEAMITAQGIEGGAIYALSAALREAILENGTAALFVDLRPDLSEEALIRRLSTPRGSQSTSTFLRKAAALAPAAVALLREAAGRSLPAEPAALAALIKQVPVTLVGVRPIERAISTAGGIARDELDARLMLKRLPGVFAAGEMLDWEAPTGGYLLQGVFATARAAAKGALAWLAERPADVALTGRESSATRPT
jgi:uncharacterized flavoprotein (TIGR03862 family)